MSGPPSVTWRLWLSVVLVVLLAGCGGLGSSGAATPEPVRVDGTSSPDQGAIEENDPPAADDDSADQVASEMEREYDDRSVGDGSATAEILDGFVDYLDEDTDVRYDDAGYFDGGDSVGLVYHMSDDPARDIEQVALAFAFAVGLTDWDVDRLVVMKLDADGEPVAAYQIDAASAYSYYDGEISGDDYLASVWSTIQTDVGSADGGTPSVGTTPTQAPSSGTTPARPPTETDAPEFTFPGEDAPTPTPTATAAGRTPGDTPSRSTRSASTPNSTATPTATRARDGRRERTQTSTRTPESGPTRTPTSSPEPTPTATSESTPTPTATPTATPEPTPTAAAAPTATPEPTPTPSPTSTPTDTPEPPPSPTSTPTPAPESTPTSTPTDTPESTPTPRSTAPPTPTATPASTASPTPSPSPGSSPGDRRTLTPTPGDQQRATPAATPSPTPRSTLAATPSTDRKSPAEGRERSSSGEASAPTRERTSRSGSTQRYGRALVTDAASFADTLVRWLPDVGSLVSTTR